MDNNNTAENKEAPKSNFAEFFGRHIQSTIVIKLLLHCLSGTFLAASLYILVDLNLKNLTDTLGVSSFTIAIVSLVFAVGIEKGWDNGLKMVLIQHIGGYWGDDPEEVEALKQAKIIKDNATEEEATKAWRSMYINNILQMVIFGACNVGTVFLTATQLPNIVPDCNKTPVTVYDKEFELKKQDIRDKYALQLTDVSSPYNATITSIKSRYDSEIKALKQQISASRAKERSARANGANVSYAGERRTLDIKITQAEANQAKEIADQQKLIGDAKNPINSLLNSEIAALDKQKSDMIAQLQVENTKCDNKEAQTKQILFWAGLALDVIAWIGIVFFMYQICLYKWRTGQGVKGFILDFEKTLISRLSSLFETTINEESANFTIALTGRVYRFFRAIVMIIGALFDYMLFPFEWAASNMQVKQKENEEKQEENTTSPPPPSVAPLVNIPIPLLFAKTPPLPVETQLPKGVEELTAEKKEEKTVIEWEEIKQGEHADRFIIDDLPLLNETKRKEFEAYLKSKGLIFHKAQICYIHTDKRGGAKTYKTKEKCNGSKRTYTHKMKSTRSFLESRGNTEDQIQNNEDYKNQKQNKLYWKKAEDLINEAISFYERLIKEGA